MCQRPERGLEYFGHVSDHFRIFLNLSNIFRVNLEFFLPASSSASGSTTATSSGTDNGRASLPPMSSKKRSPRALATAAFSSMSSSFPLGKPDRPEKGVYDGRQAPDKRDFAEHECLLWPPPQTCVYPNVTWPQLGPFFVPACPPLTAINGD